MPSGGLLFAQPALTRRRLNEAVVEILSDLDSEVASRLSRAFKGGEKDDDDVYYPRGRRPKEDE